MLRRLTVHCQLRYAPTQTYKVVVSRYKEKVEEKMSIAIPVNSISSTEFWITQLS